MLRKASETESEKCEEEKQVHKTGAVSVVPASRGRGRGKRIWLQSLMDIPVELFDEICRRLQPLDLLHLARTTKALRKYLMNRRREPLWKYAREGLGGLPGCPSYLSEPAYVNLLFCAYCHHCLTHNVQNIVFEFSTRCCNSCRKTEFVDEFYWPLGQAGITRDCLVKINGAKRWQFFVYKPHIDELVKITEKLEPKSPEYAAALASRKQLNVQILEFSAACKIWLEARNVSKSSSLESIKRKRLEDIVARLKEQGWSEELKDENSTGFHLLLKADPRVRQAKPLNNRAWNNMQPLLVKAMEEARRERLDKQRREGIAYRMTVLDTAVRDFRWTLAAKDDGAYSPTLVDFAHMEPFRQLLDPELTPDPGILERSTSEELWDQLESSTSSWQDKVIEELAVLVTSSLDLDYETKILHSAWVVFSCNHCSKDELEYPEVVAHSCLYEKPSLDPDDVFSYLVATASDNSRRHPWSSKNLALNRRLIEARLAVMAACLLPDPDSITRRFMEESDPRICCLVCSDDMTMRVSDWRTMAAHWCWLPAHDHVEILERVPDHLEVAVKQRELQDYPVDREAVSYKCSRCSPWTHKPLLSTARSDLEHHFSAKHDLKNALFTPPDVYVIPGTGINTPRTTIVLTRPSSSEGSSLKVMFDRVRDLNADVKCSLLLYEPPREN